MRWGLVRQGQVRWGQAWNGRVRHGKVNVSGASSFVRVQIPQPDMYDVRLGGQWSGTAGRGMDRRG